MELLSQVTNVQFLYPAAAVAVVLVCAALVFIFGFHSAEQPQFDKLPLVLDDRKSSNKKRKIKEKKSSPNRSADDVKTKTDSSKKSPAKEKKEEKPKEAEKPKPKPAEAKPVKKDVSGEVKKGKKKAAVEVEKPADFDEGVWEEVPKKTRPTSDKKKVKTPEEKDKKESPAKKNKKKAKDADVEAAQPVEPSEETISLVTITSGSHIDEESNRALQAQVEEFQRVLKEAERRDQAALGSAGEETAEDELTDVKDLRSNKKKENKEKQIKKKAVETAVAKSAPKVEEKESSDNSDKQEVNQNAPVFDELGDTWTDAKVSKKGKKKARKDQ